MNGDGITDIIVGARSNDAAGIDAGRAYIYFGGGGMDIVPDVTMTGAAAGDYFGWAVAGIGDLNGDGYSDVIVSAVFNIYNPFGFPDLFPYLPWGETNGLIRV